MAYEFSNIPWCWVHLEGKCQEAKTHLACIYLKDKMLWLDKQSGAYQAWCLWHSSPSLLHSLTSLGERSGRQHRIEQDKTGQNLPLWGFSFGISDLWILSYYFFWGKCWRGSWIWRHSLSKHSGFAAIASGLLSAVTTLLRIIGPAILWFCCL